jgi:hypothetical protein
MEDVGLFYGHSVYFVAIFCIWLFVIFFPFLVCCTNKNLATLKPTRQQSTDLDKAGILGRMKPGQGEIGVGGMGSLESECHVLTW